MPTQDKLSAYTRWEVESFDPPPPPAPVVEEPESVSMPQLPTAEEIEAMHEEARRGGYEEGFGEGRESGYQDGYEAGRKQAEEDFQRLHDIATHLAELGESRAQAVADELLDLALEVARQVLRQNLKVRKDRLLPVVREAILLLPHAQGHPLLFLHPEDAPLVRSQMGEQLTHGGWKILEDSTLIPGGCRIESGNSQVDATLATRWHRVVESMGLQGDWIVEDPAPANPTTPTAHE